MKNLFKMTPLLCAALIPLGTFAEETIRMDFETFKPQDYPAGCGFWADAKSKRPEWKIDSNAAAGKQALRLTFHGCKSFQGVNFHMGKKPADADAIVFWAKVLSGRPPAILNLEEKEPGGKGAEFFISQFSYGKPGVWTKINVPISSFRFLRNGGAKNANKKIDSERDTVLILIGYTPDAGSVLIDHLGWGNVEKKETVSGKK